MSFLRALRAWRNMSLTKALEEDEFRAAHLGAFATDTRHPPSPPPLLADEEENEDRGC